MRKLPYRSYEEQKRIFEVFLIVLTSCALLGLSRLEAQLFSLSESLSANREFFTTLMYFALINLNVILILALSFLIFRNVTKLIVERRRGVLGSRLRTKLVFALVFFALAPTILLFYVSSRFITSSFDTWFSEKIQITMEQTREAGSHVYKQDQKRLESLARIALQKLEIKRVEGLFQDIWTIEIGKLKGFDHEYGINEVKVFDVNGRRLGVKETMTGSEAPILAETLAAFLKEPERNARSVVVGVGRNDVVKGMAPIRDPETGVLLGVIMAEVRFETQILKSVEDILRDFGNLKPGAQLIRMSYMILLGVITLLIVFSATWLGFYVARGISGPLQSLAEATREIALGNYKIALNVKTDDETGQLVSAFNHMTRDLRTHQSTTEEAQLRLQATNEELDRRRQYMEIVLKNISAGVLAVDSRGYVTSINAAAEKLLQVDPTRLLARPIAEGLGKPLHDLLWRPVHEALLKRTHYSNQVDLTSLGFGVNLMVNASRILDENNVEVGFVVVFDDVREQVKAQRVAAWREVAQRIAHEIKNPITPIKLNAQRLLRRFNDKFEGEDQKVFSSCIETILNQVDSLRDLVNEFTRFSRLPSIRPVVTNLSDVISEVAKMFEMSYPEVVFDYQDIRNIPNCLLDKEQMNRVFVNLFTNAIAAIPEGRRGRISIRALHLSELRTVRIEFRDNGIGIPQELHERVLEPYFSTKDEGTGLGLAIVHQIITEHRGYLRIALNKPYGTAVIIEIPAAEGIV